MKNRAEAGLWPIVLVTEKEYRKGEAVFRAAEGVRCEAAPEDEAGLAAAVAARGARVVVVGVATYRGPLYEALAANGGGLIARFGVGHDGIDKSQARAHGIVVTNTPGALDASVAEHAIWLMGALARRVAELHRKVVDGGFAGAGGVEVCGRTLGVLGFGAIGRRVASIATRGFGMKVIACDQVPPEGMAGALAGAGGGEYTADARAMFGAADFVSVHLPSTPATRHFVNAERISWMRPGAFLINTARGAVLDEAALFNALAAGRLAGAALDVFETEPYVPVDPARDLRTLSHVVLTPHVGSNTAEANRRMAVAALGNGRRFLAGEMDALDRVDSGPPTALIPLRRNPTMHPMQKQPMAATRWMDRAGDILLIGLNAAMVAIVLCAVFFRYVLNNSLSWSDELVRYLFVWFSLVGSALVLREREHIRVEYFVEKFPTRLRRGIEWTMAAGVCLLHAVLVIVGTLWVWETRGTVTSALQWPLNLFFYAALPVASLLSLAYAVRRLRRGELTERDTSDRPPSDDDPGGAR